MSSDSFAAFRKSDRAELAKIAESHLNNDLSSSDRDLVKNAGAKLRTHATVGSLVGLGLGLFFAFRIRRSRREMFNAFRVADKPTHIQFAGGKTEPIPDITPLLKPTPLGDVAAFLFFSAGGLFIGGETGLLSGSFSAHRAISSNPGAQARIEKAFREFKADVLRREADALDGGKVLGIF